MASSSSTAASTSTALNPNRAYDVFINHRGPDVKKTFASFLYRRLLSQGLRVFLDLQELQQGEDLTPQIHDAINTASVHIAIFSPTYCESKWCLNELILMLETLERGATIIPLFYNVKPSDLRWTREGKGLYVKALHDLEDKKTDEGKLRYDSTTIENWRKALSRLADKSGFELARYNGDEGELLDEVVKKVLKRVKNTELEVAKYPTGLDDKMKDFENTLLLHQSGEPQILGILGLGGLGKTTLAKEFYNRKKSDYPKSCFLFDVRDNATRGSLHQLQRKLMKSLTAEDYQIDSVDEGTAMLRNQLSSVKALVIIDDVDHVSQVDALFPVQTVLRSDSLILITSRNRDVLTGSRVSSIYNLTELNADHSRELFCLHSFSQPHPLPGFGSLVDKFVKACGGLPLSLIVLGALVYEKDETYWEAQLEKLQKTLPADIKQRLQISYNALEEEERHIFLDIACFFRGENKDTAIRIWDGSGFSGRLGFDNIQNRCLVNVDKENRIQMHDHIRDLGREIAKAPGLPFRLWRGTENILQQPVITEVRGIRMVGEYNDDQHACFSWCKSWIPGDCVMMLCNILYNIQYLNHGIRMTKLQLLDVEDVLLEPLFGRVESPELLWLRWKNCPYSSLPSWIPMKNLRVLQAVEGELETLWQGESQAPLHLRELEISSYALRKIPKSIGQLKHLERIVVENGKQVILPKEFCLLQSLKVLVLRSCTEMKTLPECFGNLKNLEHIELDHCINLKSLSNSFGNLIRLKYLSAKRCESLTISSDTLGNISTLEYIDFSACKKLEALPQQVAQQKSLEVLRLTGAELKELHCSIGELSNLEVLTLGSSSLDKLPPSLGDLSSLKSLELFFCTKLKCLPSSVRRLTQLTELVVVGCPLTEVPFETVEGERGTSLKSSNLESPIEQCMPRLQRLQLLGLDILELSFSAGVCPNLQRLSMMHCDSLVEVGTLPNTLRTLRMEGLNNLRKIEGLCGLTKLQRLSLRWCRELEELRGIGTLPNTLRTLELYQLRNLMKIEGLCGLTKLQLLHIVRCKELEELRGIETLISLKELHVGGCGKLKSIRGLGCLTKLQRLDVIECSGLEELPDVEDVRSLEELDARLCPKLQWNDGVVEQLHQRLKKKFLI